jgi:hypothetical protein
MAAEQEGHLIGELLAAPIRAIQEAQIAAEREFIQFFLDYGLEEVVRVEGRTRTTALRVRNIDFEMRRDVPDPSNPGAVIERTATVSAPLMSMLNLPSVAIDEATINLSLDVVADSSAAAASRAPAAREGLAAAAAASASPRAGLPPARQAPVQLRGRIGNQSLARTTHTHGRLEVSLKLVASRDQEMLSRLNSLVTESLSARIGGRS